MADFVFVHDAFQGGWVWRRAAAELAAAGHRVHAPSLTGCGERAHLLPSLRGLSTCVADVASLVFHENLSGAVAVAAGWGALPAAAAAARLGGRIACLVLLDGFLPEAGASYTDLAGPDFARSLEAAPQDGLVAPPPPDAAVRCRALRGWYALRQVPFPEKLFHESLNIAPGALPGRVVHLRSRGRTDEAALRATQAARRLGLEQAVLEAGPLPMVTAPRGLAAALERIARAPARGRARRAPVPRPHGPRPRDSRL